MHLLGQFWDISCLIVSMAPKIDFVWVNVHDNLWH